jgi:hypothetical protein
MHGHEKIKRLGGRKRILGVDAGQGLADGGLLGVDRVGDLKIVLGQPALS